MKRIWLFVCLIPWLFSTNVIAADKEFPGRAKYPEVTVFETSQLKESFDQVVIVDTRSKLEFETLHIKGSVNIPVAAKTFEEKLAQLRATTDKPIVFYCNGRTCFKSYLGVKKATKAKIKNTFAYDAGVFEWAKTFPEYAVLLGESPIRTTSIIPTGHFKKRLLDPDTFSNHAYELGTKSLILDVRDKYQRGAAGFFPGKEFWASLDEREKLNRYIEQAKKENKTLFIYDEVGKQVRWLQYALEKANVKNYYFMEKGAKGYYANMMSEFGLPSKR